MKPLVSFLRPRVLVGTGAVALAIAFAALVWPTPFHYKPYRLGDLTTMVRISRFTGRAEMLMPTGWRKMISETERMEDRIRARKRARANTPDLSPEAFQREQQAPGLDSTRHP